jgi:hypothetical protein
MATPANVIRVPKPRASSFNKNRPLVKDGLLEHQVKHFLEVEKKLPAEQQTGTDPAKILTEGQAAEYIRKITATLHPQVRKAGGR